MEDYFEVPFLRELTKVDGWDKIDDKGVKYQVVRGIFKVVTSHLPGPSMLGRKFDVFGAPDGVAQDRLTAIEIQTEVFEGIKTIEKSISESSSMSKILASLSASFGDGNAFKSGGKVTTEMAENFKESFQNDFEITNSTTTRKNIRYEFRDTVSQGFSDRVCGAAVFQKCRADLYLLKVDFLNIEYKRSYYGLRKKLTKFPFPAKETNKKHEHPNVIHIGVPVAEIQFWELLPRSSVVIRDEDYVQEVENDAEATVNKPRDLINRPYWNYDNYPSLYQLSRVAFPFKWVNKKNGELTKEELMKMEIGEAEDTSWGRMREAESYS